MNTQIIYAFDAVLDSKSIAAAGDALRQGKLVVIPTETVYGLGANALNANAVNRIFTAKGRPQDNPLIVHISDMDMINGLVTGVPETARSLADKFWPGPLTIILPRAASVPDVVSAGLDTVAVRIPLSPIARAIIRAAGVPIAAPSANLSGSPSPTTPEHVIEDLSGRVDMIVSSHPCSVGVESTVISLVGAKPRLLRPGYITLEQLQKVIGEVTVDHAVFSQISQGEVVHSPGMKYKHYAPKAVVFVVKGSFAQYCSFVREQYKEGVFALCFDGEGSVTGIPFVEYGRQEDAGEQAQRLFYALRELDHKGAKLVYARCPDHNGVGLAVYNRLMKAAGFEVIEL